MFRLRAMLHHLLPVTESRVTGSADHPGTEADGVAGVEELLYPGEDGGADVAERLVPEAQATLTAHDLIMCEWLHDRRYYELGTQGRKYYHTSARKKSKFTKSFHII